jgi:hypothetical protein
MISFWISVVPPKNHNSCGLVFPAVFRRRRGRAAAPPRR